MYCLEEDCIFCKIAKKEMESNIVYESSNVMAIVDIYPISEGHMLIIPKKHYHDLDEIDDSTALEIMSVSKRLVKAIKEVYKPLGYSIMQNGGDYNDIGHYHMHVFPRRKDDGFSWTFRDIDLPKSFSETKELIKTALSSI